MSVPDPNPIVTTSSTMADAERIQAFRQWHASLRQLSPLTAVTPILVALNVLVFVAMAASGANPLDPTPETLLAWGADFGPATVRGEWWRLLTSAFLHSGIAHLGFNMLCLYGTGRVTERMIGSTGFLLTYLTSAIVGSLASVAWNPAVVSVGASGAVFGVFGAFFAITLRAADTIPKPALQSVRASMGKLLAINLAVGFFVPNVDVAAHIGGLVWGFAAGFLLGHALRPEAARGRMRRNMLAIMLFAPVFVLGVGIADTRVGRVNGAAAELDRIAADEEQILKVYNDAVSRHANGTLSDREFLNLLDNDVRRPWREIRRRFDQVSGDSVLNPQVMQKYGEYLTARGEGFGLLSTAIAKNDASSAARSREKMAEADRLVESLRRGR